MSTNQFLERYYKKHCRFSFKSGDEVTGVILKKTTVTNRNNYYLLYTPDIKHYVQAQKNLDKRTCNRLIQKIKLKALLQSLNIEIIQEEQALS